jgi:hypothetical protein
MWRVHGTSWYRVHVSRVYIKGVPAPRRILGKQGWRLNMASLKEVLMQRDGMTADEAEDAIECVRCDVREGADPEEALADAFGLEPDYVMDLIEGL